MNKGLRTLTICLFLSIVCYSAQAQQLVSLQPERAIEFALQNNEAVKKAEKALERAKANLRVSKAVYLPQLGVSGEYQRRRDGDIDERHYLSRGQASMLLAQFGEIPAGLDAAQEEVRKSEIEYDRVQKARIHDVRSLWHNIILTQEEIQQRRSIEIELEKKLQGTQIKHAEKRIPFLSQLNTELELSEQKLALNTLQRQLDVDTAELIRLTGLNPLARVILSGSLPDDDISLEDAVALALVNNLDLQDLQGEIERQKRRVVETIWNRFPNISAEARYKDLHLLLEQHQQNRTWDAKVVYDPLIGNGKRDAASIFEADTRARDGWEVRFNVNIPLYDGKKTQNLRSLELIELDRLQLVHIEQTNLIRVAVRRVYRAVANAKERMEIENKRVRIFEQQLRTIERVLDEVTVEIPGYQGLTYNDAFQAQAQFTEAQRVFYQSRRDYATAKERLRETMQWID